MSNQIVNSALMLEFTFKDTVLITSLHKLPFVKFYFIIKELNCLVNLPKGDITP